MVVGVCIEEPANYALVLCFVFPRLIFEKFYAPLAQRNCDLYAFIFED
jgi:hypothetical protein